MAQREVDAVDSEEGGKGGRDFFSAFPRSPFEMSRSASRSSQLVEHAAHAETPSNIERGARIMRWAVWGATSGMAVCAIGAGICASQCEYFRTIRCCAEPEPETDLGVVVGSTVEENRWLVASSYLMGLLFWLMLVVTFVCRGTSSNSAKQLTSHARRTESARACASPGRNDRSIRRRLW